MRSRASALVALVVFANCGGGEGGRSAPAAAGEGSGEHEIVRDAGCLACHRLDGEGNTGPGGDLSKIGALRSRAELRRSLTEPPDGMPSFSSLPPRELEAIVAHLSSLR